MRTRVASCKEFSNGAVVARRESQTTRLSGVRRAIVRGIIATVVAISAAGSAHATPFATQALDYSPGVGAEPGYTGDSTVVLGSPERYTGELTAFPGDVTMFSSPFGTDEVLSVGAGGWITVGFDAPIVNDPSHPYGVDLIVFGNTFFNLDFGDPNFPITGISPEPGIVEVSTDGFDWRPLSCAADGLFPTQGYLDSGEFGFPAGSVPTDFLKPIDPTLTIGDFVGLTYSQALALYDGSGGGTPCDIAESGLASASFARVRVPEGATWSTEVDAFVRVPEPATLALLAPVMLLLRRGRSRRA